MKCKDFEEKLSRYLEGEVGENEVRSMETHSSLCPVCKDMLKGVGQVRRALEELAAVGPPARFQLELSNRLEEARLQDTGLAARTLALSLALLTALAILLWPEQEDAPLDHLALEKWKDKVWEWEPVEGEVSVGMLQMPYAEFLHSEPYSHAQVRPVSF